jgi:O-antigen ligase
VLVAAGLVGFALLLYVSLRDLTTALIIWMLSMGSLRLVGLVHMPGLPDFSFDRLFLVWIVLMYAFRLIRSHEKVEGPFVADALIILHSTYVLVQLQVVDSSHFHEWVLSNLSPLFGFLYGRHIIRQERQLRAVLLFFVVLTVYYWVTAFAEKFGWRALVWPKQILDPSVGFAPSGRVRGPVVHPPLFGQMLSMFLLVYVFLLARKLRTVPRIATLLSMGLTMVALLFTYTRGPWLATVVALVVLGVLRASFRRILLGMAIVGLMIGVLGLYQVANTEFLQERMQNKGTIENRLSFLSTATRMIRDHPLFGVGFFKYNDHREMYNQATYVPFYGLVRKRFGHGMPIHDIYLGRLAEEGLVGLGLMVAFYLVVGRAWLRQWRANPRGPWFNRDTLGLFAGMMVSYLIGGMIIDYRYFDLVNVVFMLLAGIIYGFRSDTYERPQVMKVPGRAW